MMWLPWGSQKLNLVTTRKRPSPFRLGFTYFFMHTSSYCVLGGSIRIAEFSALDPFAERWSPSHPVNNRDDHLPMSWQLECQKGCEVS
jgi:hypothetical protein